MVAFGCKVFITEGLVDSHFCRLILPIWWVHTFHIICGGGAPLQRGESERWREDAAQRGKATKYINPMK
jgi:hypothetical protein